MKFATAIFALTVACASAAELTQQSPPSTPVGQRIQMSDTVTWAPVRKMEWSDDEVDGGENVHVARRLQFGSNTAGSEVIKRGKNSFMHAGSYVYTSEPNPKRMKNVAVNMAQRLGADIHEVENHLPIEDGYVTPPTEYRVEEPTSDTEEK